MYTRTHDISNVMKYFSNVIKCKCIIHSVRNVQIPQDVHKSTRSNRFMENSISFKACIVKPSLRTLLVWYWYFSEANILRDGGNPRFSCEIRDA